MHNKTTMATGTKNLLKWCIVLSNMVCVGSFVIGGVSLLGLGATAVGSGEEVVSMSEGPSVEDRRG